ncbi:MAG: class I SAM-dependent methyltransferase [Asgard group archaeon]|nr:class I SAM-dependent methyltransferase [Asgard group archaeon]
MPKIAPFNQHFQQYEDWFEEHKFVYLSELKAIKHFIPEQGKGVEIGIGTGRFAKPLGIHFGIDPSEEMRKIARTKGLEVIDAVAEDLPFEEQEFSYALMVTTICFLDDIHAAFQEVYRILQPEGLFIIGFVDKNSPLGERYLQFKHENVFYKHATFYSTEEVLRLLADHHFTNTEIIQTVFGSLSDIQSVQPFKKGFGEGGFVVIKAEKRVTTD